MVHLIDKDALVAKIERKIEMTKMLRATEEIKNARKYAFIKILSFINTLEVKEVDLKKEYKDFVEEDPVYNKLVNGIVGKAIAKHFFELGLKAQKGE